jgi:hypothetical protein
LTVRYVSSDAKNESGSRGRRRGGGGSSSSSVTTSQQSPINGMKLFAAATTGEVGKVIERSVQLLLNSVLARITLDVTRINICLADFTVKFPSTYKGDTKITDMYLRTALTKRDSSVFKANASTSSINARSSPAAVESVHLSTTSRGMKRQPPFVYTQITTVDPSVFDELPPEIAQEVRLSLQDSGPERNSKKSPSRGGRRSKTLDQYFRPRPSNDT